MSSLKYVWAKKKKGNIILLSFIYLLEKPYTTRSNRQVEEKKKISKIPEIRDGKFTFRDGTLYLSTFVDDAVIIDAFLFLNQQLNVAILGGVGRRVPLRGELDAGDKEPLNQREGDPDNGARRD